MKRKHTYQKPSIEVVRVAQQTLLAGSGGVQISTGVETSTGGEDNIEYGGSTSKDGIWGAD